MLSLSKDDLMDWSIFMQPCGPHEATIRVRGYWTVLKCLLCYTAGRALPIGGQRWHIAELRLLGTNEWWAVLELESVDH